MSNRWENPWSLTREQLVEKWQNVYEATSHIFTWTSQSELAWLCEMASTRNRIVEVGSYHGRSALCMLLANPDLLLVCYDNCENKEVPEVFAKNLKAQMEEGRVVLKVGDSRILLDRTDSFDAAFIDAGHLYEDVMLDIENCRSVLFPGGLLCGHDWRVNDPTDGVNRAVMESVGQPDGVWESIWWKNL